MIVRLNHLGIAVEDLNDAMTHYSSMFGKTPDAIEDLPERGVRVAIYDMGESSVELIEPFGSQGESIRRFLNKRGEGIHHLCFEVDDIEAEMVRLKGEGHEVLGEPVEGAGGHTVAFLRPKRGILVELLERST